jgi:hypothetical protein
MALTLTLNDRILTLKDGDTVLSSVDLSAVKGDIGVRGAQGSVSEEEVNQWIDEAFTAVPSAEGVSY